MRSLSIVSRRTGPFVGLVAFLGMPTTGNADPVIRGDVALYDVVVAALETNRESLRRQGACQADLRYDDGHKIGEATIDMVWEGDSSHCIFQYSEGLKAGDRPASVGEGAHVVSNGMRTVFVPEADLCITSPAVPIKMSYRHALPHDVCFHLAHDPHVPWMYFFRDWEAGEAIELEQSGDRIIAKLIPGDEGYSRLEFSLARGCNVVLWEMCNEDDTVLAVMRQQWEQVDGVWYPAISEHEWHDRVETSLRMEISNFDPNPTIPERAFTIAALDLPRGTELVERDATGRTIAENGYVGTPNRDEQVNLEELIEEARTGFASEEREE